MGIVADHEVYVSENPEHTYEIGKNLGFRCAHGSVISLRGPLGAGKTVFVKGLAAALEIPESITSPTYNLINEYVGKMPLFHMDLYRISGIEEFELMGADDILYGDSISVIEWSEVIDDLLPEYTTYVTFTLNDDQTRKIEISYRSLEQLD